nr:MAG TPA: hypothetical protein [Bacteriophage sp.]
MAFNATRVFPYSFVIVKLFILTSITLRYSSAYLFVHLFQLGQKPLLGLFYSLI